jgi:hypothetical protein
MAVNRIHIRDAWIVFKQKICIDRNIDTTDLYLMIYWAIS